MGLEAGANCGISEVLLTIQHLFVGMALLTVKVKALLLDAFKLVVLCAEHVDIGYDSRVPKMVKGIINNKAGGAAGVSRTESVTSCIQRIPSPSSPKPAPKPKYSHMEESTLQPCDPGKPSHDLSCVRSCDISTTLRSHDIQARDPGKVSHDLPRDWL